MRALTFREAEKLLYEKRDRFQSRLPRELDPNYRTKMANEIGGHIDRAWMNLDNIYHLHRRQLGPALKPLPDALADHEFAHEYEGLRRHIGYCVNWVKAARVNAKKGVEEGPR